MRLICAITGESVFIPSAWTAWRIGRLLFRRSPIRRAIQWRESGTLRWRDLPAIDTIRERVDPVRRLA